MNKLRITFFALLAQFNISTPVVAEQTYTELCVKYGCNDACDKNEDMWTKVREEISYCECTECSAKPTCSYVGPSNKWVLKEATANKNYTLFAGERITGIECDNIHEHAEPDYWVSAWTEAKTYLGPNYPEKIGLAINSKTSRGHNQLHIHVSCIDQDVYKGLDKQQDKMAKDPKDWKNKTLSLKATHQKNAHPWNVLFLNEQTPYFNNQNLFQLLYENVVKPQGGKMENQNLVVVGRKGGGFYILNGLDAAGESGKMVGGEGLLDEACSW